MRLIIPFSILLFFSLILGCSEHIVTKCEPELTPDNKMKASFAEIQKNVFTPTCATSGCHSGSQPPNLTEGISYTRLVGVDNLAGDMQYVEPGNSENSYLIKKLLGEGTGSLMPPSGPKLDQDIIDSIRVWIDNGAENN